MPTSSFENIAGDQMNMIGYRTPAGNPRRHVVRTKAFGKAGVDALQVFFTGQGRTSPAQDSHPVLAVLAAQARQADLLRLDQPRSAPRRRPARRHAPACAGQTARWDRPRRQRMRPAVRRSWPASNDCARHRTSARPSAPPACRPRADAGFAWSGRHRHPIRRHARPDLISRHRRPAPPFKSMCETHCVT